MRKRFAAIVTMLSLAAVLGGSSPASAYCDPVYYDTTGRCTNECVELARAYTKVTGRTAPWDCLM